MEWQLYKAVIGSTFGRGSAKPFRAALIRLACLLACSVVLGVLLSGSLASLPRLGAGSQLTLILTLTTAAQACILFVLLAASGVLQDVHTHGRLLLFWPISTTARRRALGIPSTLLALFAITLTAPTLGMVALRAGLAVVLVALCCSLGFLAALMAYRGTAPLRGWRLPAISLVLATQYWLAHASVSKPVAASLGYGALLLILTTLAYAARGNLENNLLLEYSRHDRATLLRVLPTAWWFVKKAVRNRPLRTALVTNIALSAILSVLLRQMPGGTAAAPLCASLLTATFVSDFRCLARKIRPPEITSLRGTARFLAAEAGAASTLACIVATPLVAIMQPAVPDLVRLVVSIAAGLLAGSLIVPAPKDITAQGAATLLCVALIALPVQFSDGTPLAHELLLLTFLIFVLIAALYTIEYKRNPYYWRKHVHKTTKARY